MSWLGFSITLLWLQHCVCVCLCVSKQFLFMTGSPHRPVCLSSGSFFVASGNATAGHACQVAQVTVEPSSEWVCQDWSPFALSRRLQSHRDPFGLVRSGRMRTPNPFKPPSLSPHLDHTYYASEKHGYKSSCKHWLGLWCTTCAPLPPPLLIHLNVAGY